MNVLIAFFAVLAIAACAFWYYTETPKGKKWIKNL